MCLWPELWVLLWLWYWLLLNTGVLPLQMFLDLIYYLGHCLGHVLCELDVARVFGFYTSMFDTVKLGSDLVTFSFLLLGHVIVWSFTVEILTCLESLCNCLQHVHCLWSCLCYTLYILAVVGFSIILPTVYWHACHWSYVEVIYVLDFDHLLHWTWWSLLHCFMSYLLMSM